MEALFTIVVGGAMIFGVYQCDRYLTEVDNTQVSNREACKVICAPNLVKSAQNDKCICDSAFTKERPR